MFGFRCLSANICKYLLVLLAGWTGWSDPVWLMPVRVTPSDGFFFSRLLRVRFKSTDQSWHTHTQHRVKSWTWNQQGGLVWLKTCRHTRRKKRTVQACAWQYTHTSAQPEKHTCQTFFRLGQILSAMALKRSVSVQNNAGLLEWDAQTYTV